MGAGGWRLFQSPTVVDLPVIKTLLDLEYPLALSSGRPAITLSPDGRRLVAVVDRNDTTQLYLRQLRESEGRLIPGTEGAISPFFSPDGQSVAFVTSPPTSLASVSIHGGAPTRWRRVPPVTRGGTWLDEDSIVMNPSINGALRLMTRAGDYSELTSKSPGEGSHRWPHLTPDGGAIIFTVDKGGDFDDAQISVLSLNSGRSRSLVEGGTDARATTSGHLVFGRGGGFTSRE